MKCYLCECGIEFDYSLGKYGCPDACGGVAELVSEPLTQGITPCP